ncbi:MAG: glycosyltransferase family 4 protein [Thermodesulfobacteriota bacterium]
MRVGLIIYGDLQNVSGGYIYDRMLAEHLRRKGDHVEIISLPWRGYSRHLSDNLSRGLLRRLYRASLDVLLEDELNHPSLFWINRWLIDRISYPIVSLVHHLRCSEHRPAWQNRFYQWIERLYLASVDGFVFNSHTTARVVEGIIGSKRPAVVAYPGGDRLNPKMGRVEILRRARQRAPLQIIFVGNVIPRKGLDVLISGIGHLPRDTWHLEVVGSLTVDPAYVRSIRRQIARKGLEDCVGLSGSLPDGELASRLAQSHVLAVPSSYEGFGIVYIEAMGFGLPIIASNVGAAPELITHGREGFLIHPGDSAGLAQCVGALHRDRGHLARISLAALKRYTEHPTWTESSERIRQFLHGFAR